MIDGITGRCAEPCHDRNEPELRKGVRSMALAARHLKRKLAITTLAAFSLVTTHQVSAQQGKTTGKSQPAAKTAAVEKKSADPTKDLKVVAVVNGLQIERQKLADECLRRYGKDVLDTRIHKQLILAECENRKIVITEKDVNEELARMAAKFRIPVDKYVELIQNDRDIPIKRYCDDIIWPTLALRVLAEDELKVTPAEVQKAWETEFGPSVKVAVIVCRTKDHALKVRSKCLADPEEFGTYAKNESIDKQSAPMMGSVPPVRKHLHDPRVEKAVFALKPGEISEVVSLPEMNQYLIFKCEKQVPQVFVPAEHQADAKQRIEDRIREGKSATAAAKLCENLEKRAKVRTIYTDPKLADEEPGIVAIINGAPTTRQALAEDCISRFGKVVLEGEINRTMLEGALKDRKLKVTDDMIEADMLEAARVSMVFKKDGKTPDVDAWLNAAAEEAQTTPELYISDFVWTTAAMKLLVTQEIKVTEEELKKAFEANYGRRMRALAIVGSDERRMKEVWNMAMQDPTEKTFGQLASQYSEESVSRSNGGLIPPIPRHSGRQKLEDAAFKLKKNEISAVIQVDATYYVILYGLGLTESIVDKMDAAIRKELTEIIRAGKQRDAMTTAYDNLKESAEIVNFLTAEHQAGKRVASRTEDDIESGKSSGPAAPRAGSRTAAPASTSRQR